jgi:hypothetical protein
MKLYTFYSWDDFGWEYYFNFIVSKSFCLFHSELILSEWGIGNKLPRLSITLGSYSLFEFWFSWFNFDFSFSLCCWDKCRTLNYYQNKP